MTQGREEGQEGCDNKVGHRVEDRSTVLLESLRDWVVCTQNLSTKGQGT